MQLVLTPQERESLNNLSVKSQRRRASHHTPLLLDNIFSLNGNKVNEKAMGYRNAIDAMRGNADAAVKLQYLHRY